MGNDHSLTAGFDVGQMILLLSEASGLLAAAPVPHQQRGPIVAWLDDYEDWQQREEARMATDEPRERIDRPEREQEPTVQSCVRERDTGRREARDAWESLRREQPHRFPVMTRVDELGQAHIDVHKAWWHLGWTEGWRDTLHRVYGYPKAAS